jgi:hypothetical protein
MAKEYGRIHYRLEPSEVELLNQVIIKLGYLNKHDWFRRKLRADALACGLVEPTPEELALREVGIE